MLNTAAEVTFASGQLYPEDSENCTMYTISCNQCTFIVKNHILPGGVKLYLYFFNSFVLVDFFYKRIQFFISSARRNIPQSYKYRHTTCTEGEIRFFKQILLSTFSLNKLSCNWSNSSPKIKPMLKVLLS